MAPDASSARLAGRYVLHEEFASGGMASLHFGRLVGEIGFTRTVAIKRLHPQYAKDPAFVAMLLDEARLAARIRHPNVVPILDVFATEGEVLLVMEYVHGESLAVLSVSARREGRAMPPAVASGILCGVLQGIGAAHTATTELGEPLGIVHRDVSPENVLVGADGVARVLDFGVALAVGRSQVTREGGLKGKLGYMAPEILDGCKATTLSDVYSAGVVLWEVLVGRRLFAAEHEGAMVALVLRNEVPRPSTLAALPASVDDVVLRAVSRAPGERYATAYDFAAALEAVLTPATAREVARWIQDVAGPSLQSRSIELARVERAPVAPPGESGVLEVEVSDRARTLVLPAVPRVRSPVTAQTEVMSTIARSAPPPPTAPDLANRTGVASSRRRGLALIALALVVSLGGLALASRSFRASQPEARDGEASSSASPSATSPPEEAVPASSATVEPREAQAGVTSAPSAVSAAPPSTSLPGTNAARTAPVGTRPRAVRAATPGCEPPYTIDERGIHHYKPGCL